MKRRTVQWWPQEEWTHNRWATQTLNRPHPSALITVHESHGTRPIKPHYIDRENMREQDHWSIRGGGVERWLSSLVCWLIFLGRLTFLEVLRSLEVTPLCHKTAALCPSDVGLGPNLSSLTIFQMNIDLNWARRPFPDINQKTFNCRLRWSSFQLGAMREALQMKVMFKLCVSGGETWLRCRDKRTPVHDD